MAVANKAPSIRLADRYDRNQLHNWTFIHVPVSCLAMVEEAGFACLWIVAALWGRQFQQIEEFSSQQST